MKVIAIRRHEQSKIAKNTLTILKDSGIKGKTLSLEQMTKPTPSKQQFIKHPKANRKVVCVPLSKYPLP